MKPKKITAKNNVVRILVERDELTTEEAIDIVNDTIDEILDADDPYEAEEIMNENLGLEMEYMIDLFV